MRKFLLGTVGLIALLGVAAPASAADLAARPYTKAPPPVVVPIYDWTGFYIGANGGWAQSRNCVDFILVTDFADGCRDAVWRRLRRTARLPLANQSVCLRPGSSGRLGRSQQRRASASSIHCSRPAQKLMASVFSPARSATPGTPHCSTSRAARR